jgi:1-acyl-sn-glycerol-3-phosphate acyltransferase
MIPARKSPLFNRWFANHARARVHEHFGAVYVRGLAEIRSLAEERPLLLLANHTSWWDPLVAIHACNHLLGVDAYAMMDAANLVRLPFFAKVGAFGVDLASPADGAKVVRYSVRLLDQKQRAVWVFPQGTERPITEPLRFRSGAAAIARVAKKAVSVPVGLRYEHASEERPHLYVSFGPPIEPLRDVAALTIRQEEAVGAELAAIERAVRGERAEAGFEAVYRAAPSRLGQVLERMLAAFTRPHGEPPLLPGASHDDRT